MAVAGLDRERVDAHREIARANGDKLLASPGLALDAITHQPATLTNRDLAMSVHTPHAGKDHFDAVLPAVKGVTAMVALGPACLGECACPRPALFDMTCKR